MNRYDIALGKTPPPKKIPEPAIEPKIEYYLGIDIGLRRDPTAIAICHLSTGYEPSIIRTTVDYLEETSITDMSVIRNWLKGLNCKYPIKKAYIEQYYGIYVENLGINFSAVPRITPAMENIYQSWALGPEIPLRDILLSSHKEVALKLCLWSIHETQYMRSEMNVLRGYNPRIEQSYIAPERYIQDIMGSSFNQNTPYRNYTRYIQRQMSELNPDSPYRGQF
jgi:hypothetical protein